MQEVRKVLDGSMMSGIITRCLLLVPDHEPNTANRLDNQVCLHPVIRCCDMSHFVKFALSSETLLGATGGTHMVHYPKPLIQILSSLERYASTAVVITCRKFSVGGGLTVEQQLLQS